MREKQLWICDPPPHFHATSGDDSAKIDLAAGHRIELAP
jgi:hypothetical protein